MLALLVPLAVDLHTDVSPAGVSRRHTGAPAAHEGIEDHLLSLRGLLDQVPQECHRLFLWMPRCRDRVEVQHIAITSPIEMAASLVCEEDHPLEARIGALPDVRRVLHPQERVAEAEIPLNEG